MQHRTMKFIFRTIICCFGVLNCRCYILVAFSLPFTTTTSISSISSTSSSSSSSIKNEKCVYTNERIFKRYIPHLTPSETYDRCVRGFRNDNLGLPPFVPFPVIENFGDDSTGVGFILRRTPLQLKEGIVDSTVDTANGLLILYYKVLNPSYTTFPVKDHLGTITISPKNDNDDGTCTGGSNLIWKVQWTPLFPTTIINIFVTLAIMLVINCACNYIARDNQQKDR